MKDKEKYSDLKKRLLKYRNATERVQRLRLRMNENRRGDDMEELKPRVERQEQRADRFLEDLNQLLEKIKNERYKDILIALFIDGDTFSDVAKRIGYCERHIRRIYERAIDQLIDILYSEE